MRIEPSALLAPRYLLRRGAPLWPMRLCDLDHPPAQIEIAGQLPEFSQAVAVVGTRKPTPEAAAFARRLGRELSEAGRIVISGGAEGIDAEAHRGALQARGRTIAVLGTPLARPYPRANAQLFREILVDGCVLSELLTEDDVYRSRFLERNRLIAALATVVIVVQAPLVSGALSTAAEAIRLGRTLFAVPYAPWQERGAGGVALLSAGARVCRGSADVLSLAPAGSGERAVAKPRKRLRRPNKVQEIHGLDDDERAVVGVLSGPPLTADELCEATGLSAPRLQRAILMLLLSKAIQEVGSGRYARCLER